MPSASLPVYIVRVQSLDSAPDLFESSNATMRCCVERNICTRIPPELVESLMFIKSDQLEKASHQVNDKVLNILNLRALATIHFKDLEHHHIVRGFIIERDKDLMLPAIFPLHHIQENQQ